MKVLLLILSLCLIGCSSSKDCLCSNNYITVTDTIVIPEMNDDILCVYVEECIWVVEDTIWIECFNENF